MILLPVVIEGVTSDPWQEEDSQRSDWRRLFTPPPLLFITPPWHFCHESRDDKESAHAPATILGLPFCCPRARTFGSLLTCVLFQDKQTQTNYRPVTGYLAEACKQISREEDQELPLEMRLPDYPEAGEHRYKASTDACSTSKLLCPHLR